MPSGMRKRWVLTLAVKLEIITISKKEFHREMLPKSLVYQNLQCVISPETRRKSVSAAEDPESFAKKRHIVRRPHFAKLDEAIHLWFVQERGRGAPVSGPLLQEKASYLLPASASEQGNVIGLVSVYIYIIIGERAKRARHSQVCSIENRGYIYV